MHPKRWYPVPNVSKWKSYICPTISYTNQFVDSFLLCPTSLYLCPNPECPPIFLCLADFCNPLWIWTSLGNALFLCFSYPHHYVQAHFWHSKVIFMYFCFFLSHRVWNMDLLLFLPFLTANCFRDKNYFISVFFRE